MPNNNYDGDIDAAGQKYNVDPALIKTVFHLESSGGKNTGPAIPGDPDSPIGPMQMRPSTAKTLGVDPTNIHQAIDGAARYLAQGLNLTQSPEGALRYYYGGPDQSQWGPKTDAYAAKGAAMYPQMQLTGGGQSTQEAQPAKLTGADIRKSFEAPQAPAAADASPGAKIRSLFPTQEAPTATPPQQPAATAPVQVDDLGRPLEAPSANANPVEDAAKSAVQGAKEGFGGEPLGLSPEHEKQLQDAGVYNKPGENNPLKAINKGIIGGLAAGGDLALRTGAALLRGGQGAVSSALSSIPAASIEGPGFLRESAASLLNPSLAGRDVAATPEAFPTGDTTGGTAIPAPQAAAKPNPLTTTISQAAHDQLDAPLAAKFKDNPGAATPSLPAGETTPNPLAVTRPESVPLAAPGTPPQPQSVGAAASRDLSNPSAIGITPAQELAYRSTAEGQKLLEPQQPGIADPTVYVPGVAPNAAEIEQQVNTARELKALNVSAPEVSQEAKEIAAQNNDTRQQYFSNAAGSPVSVQNLRDARKAQFAKDSEATLSSGTAPADTKPVTSTVQDILSSPTGKQNTELQTYVKPLLNRLQNADGTPKITDPAELIGFRQDVNRMLSKTSQAATPNLGHISQELQSIVDATDDAIEAARPGYAKQRANYADYSRQIDAQTALQELEPKLYGANNQMQYSRVQNAMRQIVDARSSPGNNKFKAIPDDTMQQLWNLRDDLRRSASAQELARTPGSDTTQTMADVLKGIGKSTGNLAVHGALLSHMGPVGNILYNGAKHAIGVSGEARAAAKRTARGLQILHPDPSKLRNPLHSGE